MSVSCKSTDREAGIVGNQVVTSKLCPIAAKDYYIRATRESLLPIPRMFQKIIFIKSLGEDPVIGFDN